MEQGTPIEVRDILGKSSISYADFLVLPLVTKNRRCPGLYLSHVVDVDSKDATYVGSSIKGPAADSSMQRHITNIADPD
jgi:hypothetical protein